MLSGEMLHCYLAPPMKKEKTDSYIVHETIPAVFKIVVTTGGGGGGGGCTKMWLAY